MCRVEAEVAWDITEPVDVVVARRGSSKSARFLACRLLSIYSRVCQASMINSQVPIWYCPASITEMGLPVSMWVGRYSMVTVAL